MLDERHDAAPLYLFDLVAIASGLAVAAGRLAIHVGDGSAWRTEELCALGPYAIAIVALTVRRQAAYTQAIPWLVGFFSVAVAR